MLKGYYINETCFHKGKLIAPGVENKICQQIEVFRSEFEIKRLELRQEEFHYIRKRIPFYKNTYNINQLLHSIDRPDFIYFRKCRLERGLYYFFKAIKNKYPNCKILMEIPTYPYDKEFLKNNGKVIFSFPFYVKDVFYRNLLYKYIDKIVTYGVNDSEIFGIPVLILSNGINVEHFSLKKRKLNQDNISLLAVANFQCSHGYERIIQGLRDYYSLKGNRRIDLYLVGEGKERYKYEQLSSQFGLNEHVKFLGQLKGKALDDIFDKADIGLGCFGLYKYNLENSSALKIREYLSRGIPVISGCNEDVLSGKNLPFFLQFSNDNSIINMHKVVEFYDQVYTYDNIESQIREYAKKTVDMSIVLKGVMRFIKIDYENI